MNTQEIVNHYGISVGTDSEGFLINKDGHPISSIGKIGGSKVQPRITEHGAVQEDNVLVEFNTHPARSADEFVNNIRLVLSDLGEIITPLDLSVDFSATKLFDDKELIHPLARIAGCDPDYDAYELQENDPPDLGAMNLRSAGGHVHISWEQDIEDFENIPTFCKYLDLFLGVPSVLLDQDIKRRELYGKAGCHRPKLKEIGDQYDGVEYRSLSPFWLKSDKYIRWVFNNSVQALNAFKSNIFPQIDTFKVRDIINTSDMNKADVIVQNLNIQMP